VENETVYRVLPFLLNCKQASGQKAHTHGGGRLNINRKKKITFLPLINVPKHSIFFKLRYT